MAKECDSHSIHAIHFISYFYRPMGGISHGDAWMAA